ncbi:MAG: hypothetical protein ABJP08_29055 [Roseibium sp.]
MRALKVFVAGVFVGLFGLLAIALVGYHIALHAELKLPDFKSVSNTTQQDEIRSYALFTHVAWGAHEVVTGVEYASDRDRQITSQWCYLSGKPTGERTIQLTLANKTIEDNLTLTDPTDTALADFDLTRATARELVTSHCRFR